jgi:hypothetical protein
VRRGVGSRGHRWNGATVPEFPGRADAGGLEFECGLEVGADPGFRLVRGPADVVRAPASSSRTALGIGSGGARRCDRARSADRSRFFPSSSARARRSVIGVFTSSGRAVPTGRSTRAPRSQ